MNPSKFDTIVKNRAQQRVEDNISKFKEALSLAVYNLTDGKISPQHNYRWWEGAECEAIMKALGTNTWPAYLWETQAEKVTAALLSTMDEMNKALCAPGPKEGPETPKPAAQP